MTTKKRKRGQWVFWLAVILSVIGVLAVVMLALHALGVV